MNEPSRTVSWLVWGSLAFIITGIFGAFLITRWPAKGSGAFLPLPRYGRVPNFTLTNQFGKTVTLADLQGQLWLANIIFTRCSGPCMTMSRQLSELQTEFKELPQLRLVSLTADPEHDTVDVLEKYGRNFGAQSGQWWFLSGQKSLLIELATDGLKLAVVEKKPDERENETDLFIHSTLFVLVDPQANIRGVFESADPEFKTKILNGVRRLAQER